MADRRTFLTSVATAMAGLATGCLPVPGRASRAAAAAAGGPLASMPNGIGLQLYTVRSLLATSFEPTLEAVAALGYSEVEFAGYHRQVPATVRAALDRYGLRAPSAHVAVDATGDAWARLVDDAAIVGHRWLTLPWVDGRRWTEDRWHRLAATLNDRGAAAARAGLRVAYHNHDFELRGQDRLPLEILLAETDPALVDFEMDVYWLVAAGHDPIAWLERGTRFRMLHLKDTAGAPDHRMTDVGKGVIDWSAVLRTAARQGALHHFVEHDSPERPLESAAASHAHLAARAVRPAP